MKNIKKTGQQCQKWYTIALGMLGCLLLISLAPPLLAGEIHSTKKQLRLADRTGFLYGLKGGKVLHKKSKQPKISSPNHRRVYARQIPKRAGVLIVRPSTVKARGMPVVRAKMQLKSSRPSHKAHKQRETARQQIAHAEQNKQSQAHQLAKRTQQAERPKRTQQTKLANRTQQTELANRTRQAKPVTTAPSEQRMGTFMEPVNVSATARSSGLFFRVQENSDVMATATGQVVYAGWFRGYGLLTILNHGGRVYSLYGHNRDLLVTKGDSVVPGQVIAKSGKTGSADGVPGVYFEIRKGNKPENPKRWLVKGTLHQEEMASLMR